VQIRLRVYEHTRTHALTHKANSAYVRTHVRACVHVRVCMWTRGVPGSGDGGGGGGVSGRRMGRRRGGGSGRRRCGRGRRSLQRLRRGEIERAGYGRQCVCEARVMVVVG
jgi:hypothetical protein